MLNCVPDGTVTFCGTGGGAGAGGALDCVESFPLPLDGFDLRELSSPLLLPEDGRKFFSRVRGEGLRSSLAGGAGGG
jgi:hypothetical protein